MIKIYFDDLLKCIGVIEKIGSVYCNISFLDHCKLDQQ